jgi:hypothetical protein
MVEECSDTRIHGLESGQRGILVYVQCPEIPLRMEGNALCPRGLGLELPTVSKSSKYTTRGALHALVNMDGEDMTEIVGKPQLRLRPEYFHLADAIEVGDT